MNDIIIITLINVAEDNINAIHSFISSSLNGIFMGIDTYIIILSTILLAK